MGRNIAASKRGFGYRHGTAESGGLGLYVDGLMVVEYENYNDQLMLTYGKSLTGVPQGIYEESVTQNYPIGTRRVVDDMVFKYCHSRTDPTGQASLPLANRGVVNTHLAVLDTTVVAASVAATTITATVAGVAANSYENGYIIQQPTVGWTQNSKLRIKSNTTTVFTLKDPLVESVATTDNLFFSKNMYAAVGKSPVTGADSAYRTDRSIVAVPLLDITSEYYFWGQTWGPCCVQFGDATYRAGDTSYGDWGNRVVWFDHYGAASCGSEPDDSPAAPYKCGRGVQIAGFCIPCTYDTGGIVDWSILIFLQLTPV